MMKSRGALEGEMPVGERLKHFCDCADWRERFARDASHAQFGARTVNNKRIEQRLTVRSHRYFKITFRVSRKLGRDAFDIGRLSDFAFKRHAIECVAKRFRKR